MIRTDAELSVSRFCELIGIPRRTYHHWLARHRAGNPTRGPWPAPVVDRIEPEVGRVGDQDAVEHVIFRKKGRHGAAQRQTGVPQGEDPKGVLGRVYRASVERGC
jgi:hypothetical protein